MYAFIIGNDMCVADMLNEQPVSYTFKEISHLLLAIIISNYFADSVKKCVILCDDGCNTRENLPVSMKVMLPMPSQSVKSNTFNVMKSYPRPRWQDPEFIKGYKDSAKASLNETPVVKPSDIPRNHVKTYIISLNDSICEGIHNSVKMNIKQESIRSIRRPKRWFSSSCKAARNRNKLFHYIHVYGSPVGVQMNAKFMTVIEQLVKIIMVVVDEQTQTKSQRITTLIETMYWERKSKKVKSFGTLFVVQNTILMLGILLIQKRF